MKEPFLLVPLLLGVMLGLNVLFLEESDGVCTLFVIL